METTIVYWGLYGDNGKENGNYYSIIPAQASARSAWQKKLREEHHSNNNNNGNNSNSNNSNSNNKIPILKIVIIIIVII